MVKKTSNSGDRHHLAYFLQLSFLLLLVTTGLVVYFFDLLEWRQTLEWARNYTQYWWLAPFLIGIQVIFFMFALPGSTIFWIIALLYPPVSATIFLVLGSTLGGLAAYLFSRTLVGPWKNRIQHYRIFHLLEKRGDFLSICALRVMPGFPHSVINYSSGILHIPIGQFLAATIIGLTFKTYLYANVVYQAVEAADPKELIQLETIGPLIILTILLLLARLLQHYWLHNHNKQ